MLKVINLALNIIKNEPINHVEAKTILGGSEKATIRTYFYDKRKYICCLETLIIQKLRISKKFTFPTLSAQNTNAIFSLCHGIPNALT